MLVVVGVPVMIAVVPLNFTVLLVAVVLKLVPEIVTVAPTNPLVGLREVIVGDGMTVKLVMLVAVCPFTATVIVPVAAPVGTEVTMLVVVGVPVIVAVVPLNFTTLFAGVVSKFVPVIVTVAPNPPLVGLKLVIVGDGITVKLVVLVAVWPLTVKVMVPVEAPAGTEVVIEVADTTAAFAVVPLNFKMFAKVASKLVPAIKTTVPTPPLVGLKLVIVRAGITVKVVELVPVWPLTVTVIVPVVAPTGTEVVILVVVLAVTIATVPLNLTILFAGVVSKFVPVIVTDVPTPPLVGLKLVMAGGRITVKLVELVPV